MIRKIKRRNAIKTRRNILSAARGLFAQHGFAGTSMRAIAQKSNIRAATMYHYFSSKNAILFEIFETFYNELAEVYAAVQTNLSEKATIRDGLVQLMVQHKKFLSQRSNFAYLFFLEALRPGTPVNQQLGTLSKKSTNELTGLAQRWNSVKQDKMLTLLMAVVSIDVFFSIADKYLARTTGINLSEEDILKTLAALIGSEGRLEKELTT